MRTVFVVMFLLAPSVLRAQSLPDAPKRQILQARLAIDTGGPVHHDVVFWTGVSLLAASQTADAWTTQSNLNRGGWENDPLLGRHPSPARLALTNSVFFVAQAVLFRWTEGNRHSWVRWGGRAALGAAIAEHARLAACNSQLDLRSSHVHNCPGW